MWLYLLGLMLALIPPLVGGSMLKRQIDTRDQRSRQAVGEGALRVPGHRLLPQIADAHVDIFTYLLLAGLCFIYPVVVLKLEQLITGIEGNIGIPVMFGAVALLLSGYRLQHAIRTLTTLRSGLAAELEVGSHADQLMRQGYFIFHDVPCQGFHIDHVVVGRNGVFAIETHHRRPPRSGGGRHSVTFELGELCFPGHIDSETIVQTRGQAIWLGKWLGKLLGFACQPTPVLCLPGWHVELKSTPSFPILNQKYLGWTIPGWDGQLLDDETIERICALISERCRQEPTSPIAQAA